MPLLRRPAPFLLVLILLMSFVRGTPPPNVIVMLADDQGWGDLSLHGHPSIQTPRLDALARDGAQFDRFYVQPVCAPTRAEFLTGRYHLRGGVRGVSRGFERLALAEETIADVFRAAGYATGSFGKWHNGTQFPYHPNGRGFDEFYGFTSGHWGNYFDAQMDHNGDVVTGVGYITDDVTQRALDFALEQHAAEKPFFIHLALPTPHSPMQVPDEYWDDWADRDVPRDHRFAATEDPAHSRAALAMVENIDGNVGRLLDGLDEVGAGDNTIVVYFTDNGPNGTRWNGDFKGRKGSTDEGGVRSPLFIRWRGQIAPGTVIRGVAGAIDLLPTLTHLADIDYRPRHPLDGKSLSRQLTGEAPETKGRWMFAHWSGRTSVRGERWMLDHEGELFDLAADPGQYDPVTAAHPAVVTKLQDMVAQWHDEMPPTKDRSKPPFTVGHADAKFTLLPARDATLHGGLERSNRFPNDSYVRNWTQPTDKLTWEVDVLAKGRFAVIVYYTCPPEDVGATLRIDCGDAFVEGIVGPAWDPPELGAEHDRIPRQESYVKHFRALEVGEISLQAGHTTLTLTCPIVVGATALEFRLLQLRRLR